MFVSVLVHFVKLIFRYVNASPVKQVFINVQNFFFMFSYFEFVYCIHLIVYKYKKEMLKRRKHVVYKQIILCCNM